jgi:hypothetical protein
MKKVKLSLILLFMFFGFSGIAQSISPAPGNSTVCPGETVTYTVNPNPNFSGCSSFTWTITNGSFVFGANPAVTTKTTTVLSVDVFWNDVASTGTLKVTSNCTQGAMSVGPLSYAIRSLAGRTPANARSTPVHPYCDASGLTLLVDVMFLENTGGATGITQQRADGYEWVLPAGWMHNGSPGTVTTASELINIAPDNGCRGGTVTVKAYVNCNSGKKYSSPASININRTTPTLTITAPTYTGGGCGKTDEVGFTVTPISCATSYVWNFSGPNASTPSGWLSTPTSSGTNNFINVRPSGSPADAGSVKVSVTLSCGTTLFSSPFTLTFAPPTISLGASNAICPGGTSVTLANLAGSTVVDWTTSSNMTITSGQGTTTATIKGNSPFMGSSGTITASFTNCPGITTITKAVHEGLPYLASKYSDGNLVKYTWPGNPVNYNSVCNLIRKTVDMTTSGGSGTWQRIAANPTGTSWSSSGNNVTFYFYQVGQTATFRYTANNSCGTVAQDFSFKSVTCGGGGCTQFTVSPNRSANTVRITAPPPNIPAPCGSTSRLEPQETIQPEQAKSKPSIQSIAVYDFNGQAKRSKQFTTGTTDADIDISDLGKGVYIMVVSDGTVIETHRIIKE